MSNRATHPKEFSVWSRLVQKCTNSNDPGYATCGGRGVTLCASWRGAGGFGSFFAAIGPKPSKAHALVRLQADIGFEPGNVAWRIPERKPKKARPPAYMIWSGMVQRCTNKKEKLYKYYGARGITVHPDWMGPGGYERFFAHIGPRPSPLHSVDRIKNDRGYEPGNVRWATDVTQMRNTRRAILITHNDETLPLKTWCERLGRPYKTVHLRIKRFGWDPLKALTTPILKRGAA